MIPGSCLCGAIRLVISGDLGPITACHCTQCRKTSGHYAASFDVEDESRLKLTGTLRWYRLASGAQRAFCGTCGSKVGFRDAAGNLSVEAGIIDGPTGSRLTEHIFTACKGDYYVIADDAHQAADRG